MHRFTRTVTVPDGTEVSVADQEYAQLSLAMRCGVDAGEVFDALLARGQLRVHSGDAERLTWLAEAGIQAMVAGSPAAVVADTREQVAELNAAIRERLVGAGRVDDERATTTNAGQRIGVGDRVATRRNNAEVGVANRDTWTVTQLGRGGDVTVTGQRGERTLPAEYVGEHLELAYASTVHGVQGETATCAHMAIGEYTSAASAYVGMTRGRTGNTAHLIADSIDEARGQWVAVFARDRADLGPAHAAELAAHDASRYAQLRPLEQALAELRQQWAVEQDCLDRLARDEQHRDLLGEIVPLRATRERELPPLEHAYRQARESARHAEQQALSAQRVLDDVTERIRDSLLAAWDQARDAVRGHAQTVREGGGRFGQHRPALARASGQLTAWADAWRPVVPDLPTTIDRLVDRVLWFEDRPRLWDTVDKAARGQAEHTHPDAVTAIDEADRAAHARRQAWRVYRDTDAHFEQALAHYGNLARTEQPAQLLAQLEIDIAATGRRLDATQTTITALLAQPTLRALPAEQITAERDHWHIEHDAQARERYARSAQPDVERAPQHHRHVHRPPVAPSTPDHSPGISR